MVAPDLLKNSLILEQETVVDGKTRWVAHAEDESKPLLVLEFGENYYALPLYCEHAHASLLDAKLTEQGKLICPKHGLETDLASCPKSIQLSRKSDRFYIKEPRHNSVEDTQTGLLSADSNDEVEILKTVNNALQKKVLSNLESMDQMLSQVEHQKLELEDNNQYLLSINELIAGIMNSIEEFIIVTDSFGKITRVNRYAESILQIKAKQLVGLSPDALLSDRDFAHLSDEFPEKNWDQRPYIYRAVYREHGYEKELRFKIMSAKDGKETEQTFLLKGTLLFSHQGKEEGLILSATDISVIKQQEETKRKQELEKHLLLLQNTLASISYGVAMFDQEGLLLTANSLFNQLTAHNISVEKTVEHYNELFPAELLSVKNTIPAPEQLKGQKQSWRFTYSSGDIIEFDASPSHSGGFVITACDVTEKTRLDEHIRLLSTTVEQSTSEIIITDTDGIIVYVNPMFTENTGFSSKEAIGKKTSIVRSGDMPDRFYAELWKSIKEEHSWKGEVINRKKNGEKFWQSMSIAPIYDAEGEVSHYLSLKSDITKQKEAEKQLRYQAEHDLLTGLPNRPVLLAEMDKAITAATENHRASAILFMDLDNFKDVNDTLGHISGDYLLQLVAKRLQQCVSGTDVIARLGGDEFAVIQHGIQSSQEPVELAQRLIQTLTGPFKIDDHLLHIGVSVGITLLPEDGLDTGVLLSNADIAMYEAKAISGSRYKFFDSELQQKIQRKRQIEVQLHSAIEKDELTLVFQAKTEIKTGDIVGAEVLLRWNNHSLGFISPAEFIPIAETSGLIIELGNWVLDKTLHYLDTWKQYPVPLPKIAVNLSAVQLRDINLSEDISNALTKYEIAPSYLELEITETAAMADTEFSMQQLDELKRIGISLAMDDFGTGYSSLSYLASLPMDRIKIDRVFVNDIQNSKQSRAIIESIIHLGKIMDKTVIAEGVEEQAQLELLDELGCDEAQGYLISKPIIAEEFIQLLLDSQKG